MLHPLGKRHDNNFQNQPKTQFSNLDTFKPPLPPQKKKEEEIISYSPFLMLSLL